MPLFLFSYCFLTNLMPFYIHVKTGRMPVGNQLWFEQTIVEVFINGCFSSDGTCIRVLSASALNSNVCPLWPAWPPPGLSDFSRRLSVRCIPLDDKSSLEGGIWLLGLSFLGAHILINALTNVHSLTLIGVVGNVKKNFLSLILTPSPQKTKTFH